jgi:hypothetical protein
VKSCDGASRGNEELKNEALGRREVLGACRLDVFWLARGAAGPLAERK